MKIASEKQTHQRDTPERHTRETRESAPFLDRRRDQQGVKRVANDCSLSHTLSQTRSLWPCKNGIHHSFGGSPFHRHRQNARAKVYEVYPSSVCGKEKTRDTTKNAKGEALRNKSQSCPPLWYVLHVLLHRLILFLFCCVCVRGRRRRSFETTKEALSRSGGEARQINFRRRSVHNG